MNKTKHLICFGINWCNSVVITSLNVATIALCLLMVLGDLDGEERAGCFA